MASHHLENWMTRTPSRSDGKHLIHSLSPTDYIMKAKSFKFFLKKQESLRKKPKEILRKRLITFEVIQTNY